MPAELGMLPMNRTNLQCVIATIAFGAPEKTAPSFAFGIAVRRGSGGPLSGQRSIRLKVLLVGFNPVR
jgi:hypothetical protein